MSLSPMESSTSAAHRCERIYLNFFNLESVPFSITPDPDFLFLSDTHRSVIEKINYGIESRMGFMLLTGEVGTGKSTLCRVLLDQLQNLARTVYVINPSLSGKELIASILDDLGVARSRKATKKALIDHLNRFLLGLPPSSPVVIIIDDAQTMPVEALEDLRLLSNLETDKDKLLQMLLVGQPELLQLLDRPELRQLKQRITVNCYLEFLSPEEVRGYVEQRLFVAGNKGQVRFSPGAVSLMHKQSGGIPRLINKIGDMALTAAYVGGNRVVGAPHLRVAYRELIEFQPQRERRWHSRLAGLRWLIFLALLLSALVAWGWFYPAAMHFDAGKEKESAALGLKNRLALFDDLYRRLFGETP